MRIQLVLPFLSTLVIFLFAVLVFRRYLLRKGTHLLLWGIGLVMFGVGSFAEAYSVFGWNPLVFRLWYLGGAVLNAAWLGQGTVYLLARRKVAHVLMILLLLGSLYATYAMFTTPLQAAGFDPATPLSEQYRQILPKASIRRMTPLFNIYGTITLVGGALYSAWLLWKRQVPSSLVWGNVLIAAGALSIAFASTLTRLGLGAYLYLGELLAATLMFAGFLLATRRVVRREL
ncbi:MAG: hypothetical protein QN121_11805 [Armatimonadota bacterium]|nr:hypothetical protein [Armatimonadota bacterium]